MPKKEDKPVVILTEEEMLASKLDRYGKPTTAFYGQERDFEIN